MDVCMRQWYLLTMKQDSHLSGLACYVNNEGGWLPMRLDVDVGTEEGLPQAYGDTIFVEYHPGSAFPNGAPFSVAMGSLWEDLHPGCVNGDSDMAVNNLMCK
jgi:hypothetical protein